MMVEGRVALCIWASRDLNLDESYMRFSADQAPIGSFMVLQALQRRLAIRAEE